MKNKNIDYDIRPISLNEVRQLCEKYHRYGSAGEAGTYCFGIFEPTTFLTIALRHNPKLGHSHSQTLFAIQSY